MISSGPDSHVIKEHRRHRDKRHAVSKYGTRQGSGSQHGYLLPFSLAHTGHNIQRDQTPVWIWCRLHATQMMKFSSHPEANFLIKLQMRVMTKVRSPRKTKD
jgi:hypothetical protein